ncbi:MAG: hypothetical protein H5U40_02530, partial [Polyangiaceae bacterium]|nr:hypothetical protein [Polyangiaceae bacterium]
MNHKNLFGALALVLTGCVDSLPPPVEANPEPMVVGESRSVELRYLR